MSAHRWSRQNRVGEDGLCGGEPSEALWRPTPISLLENPPRCPALARFTEEETEGQGSSESHQKAQGHWPSATSCRLLLQLLSRIRSLCCLQLS